MIFINLIYLLV